MNQQQIEEKIRQFLAEDMMKEQAKVVDLDVEMELDSLDQTELRVFLEEEFGATYTDANAANPFFTLRQIIQFANAAVDSKVTG
ncbi:acyl carrier protein [Paraburkholderia bryophila]|uniref:acyl carrier protein n=1 Tax=Paraburkholderia bryophila TaxID=420952 RepID=UPI00234B8662|nr:acyl carrier protein [Paraburkholderia bryophila]WCM23151.1 acyl carrier protein [Paraburkholderia bryophila]